MNFRDRFSKEAETSSIVKHRVVGVQLLHADGLNDTTKLVVVFRNFANLKNEILIIWKLAELLLAEMKGQLCKVAVESCWCLGNSGFLLNSFV